MNHGQKLIAVRQSLISQVSHDWAGDTISFPLKQRCVTPFIMISKPVHRRGEWQNSCLIRGEVFQGVSVSCAHRIMQLNQTRLVSEHWWDDGLP